MLPRNNLSTRPMLAKPTNKPSSLNPLIIFKDKNGSSADNSVNVMNLIMQ